MFLEMPTARIPPIAILCIFIGDIQEVCHLGRGVDEESNKKQHGKEGMHSKKWCPSHKFFYILYSVTYFLFLLGFDKAPIILQWVTKRAHPRKCLPVYLK